MQNDRVEYHFKSEAAIARETKVVVVLWETTSYRIFYQTLIENGHEISTINYDSES